MSTEPTTTAVDHFDNAPNTEFTNRIYPPVEIGTKLYTTPQPAQATQAEVTDEREAFEACEVMAGSLFKRRADDPEKYWDGNVQDDWELWQARAILALRPAAVPMTPREIELIDGMIAVQLDHAQRCDAIGNRVMGEKQKGWDMERVELLRRIKSIGTTAQPKKETP